MTHLEKNWYGVNAPLIGPNVDTACGKNVPIGEITRTWPKVDCPECVEHLDRLADETVSS